MNSAVADLDGYRRRGKTQTPLLNATSSTWAVAVHARLSELSALKQGWDGFNALVVRPDAAYFAANFLNSTLDNLTPAPFIAPLTSGGLQLEWHLNGMDIEVEIEGPNSVRAYVVDRSRDEEHEVEMASDFTPFLPFVPKLSGLSPSVKGAAA